MQLHLDRSPQIRRTSSASTQVEVISLKGHELPSNCRQVSPQVIDAQTVDTARRISVFAPKDLLRLAQLLDLGPFLRHEGRTITFERGALLLKQSVLGNEYLYKASIPTDQGSIDLVARDLLSLESLGLGQLKGVEVPSKFFGFGARQNERRLCFALGAAHLEKRSFDGAFFLEKVVLPLAGHGRVVFEQDGLGVLRGVGQSAREQKLGALRAVTEGAAGAVVFLFQRGEIKVP